MHALYDEDGDFKAATILTEQDNSLQVESASGKRSKIKKNQVLLRFAQPSPSEMLTQAHALCPEIDLDFLWECALQDEFDFQALAADYFGAQPRPHELAALLLRLHGAPMYFYRKGRGRYRPAPPETLKAALAGLEKKRLLAQQQADWAEQLARGEVPETIARSAIRLLVAPDKQSIEYKALEQASQQMQRSMTRILLDVGAVPSSFALLRESFLLQQALPGAAKAAALTASIDEVLQQRLDALLASLPAAPAPAFSLDDITTTEVDDALSVQWLTPDCVRVGIHIAAPALAIERGDAVDLWARQRMSTIYMPGDKITMLPDAVVEKFSLDEGTWRPAVSLYFDLQQADAANPEPWSELALSAFKPSNLTTRVERIQVAANLRHNHLEALATSEALDAALASVGTGASPSAPEAQAFAWAQELGLLHRLAQALLAERERVRGKPEPRGRYDFNYYVDWADDPRAKELGLGVPRIERRLRGAPLDTLVAELMILANSHWGGWLAQQQRVGIYRTQGYGRVRMQTSPGRHEGLGVAQYAWCTSPLRRYVDMVNQMQVVSAARAQATVFNAQDADLFAIVSGFDTAYSAYSDFQQRMERYWCLRWLQQHEVRRTTAACMKEDLFRLQSVPLVVRVVGAPELARGAIVEVDIVEMDEIDLSVFVRFVAVANVAADNALPDDEDEEAEAIPDESSADSAPAQAEPDAAAPDALNTAAPTLDALSAPLAAPLSAPSPNDATTSD